VPGRRTHEKYCRTDGARIGRQERADPTVGAVSSVEVDELAATLEALSERGLRPGPEQHPAGPQGPQGPRTSWLTDPDGYRIELVQWPPRASRRDQRRRLRLSAVQRTEDSVVGRFGWHVGLAPGRLEVCQKSQ
jgi:hypothetical protein